MKPGDDQHSTVDVDFPTPWVDRRSRMIGLISGVALVVAFAWSIHALPVPELMAAATTKTVRGPDVLAVEPLDGFPVREASGDREWWWMTSPSGVIGVSGPPSHTIELTMIVGSTPCGPASVRIGSDRFDANGESKVTIAVELGSDGLGTVDVTSLSAPCGPPDGARQLYVGVFDPEVGLIGSPSEPS